MKAFLAVATGLTLLILSGQLAFDLELTTWDVSIPITAQSLAASVIAIQFKDRYGLWVVALYLLLGFAGLPVFADGAGGWHHFTGPSSGYLLAFLILPVLFGRKNWPGWRSTLTRAVGLVLLCHVVVLLVGGGVLAWKKDWQTAWTYGVSPFLAGAALKSVIGGLVVHVTKDVRFWQ